MKDVTKTDTKYLEDMTATDFASEYKQYSYKALELEIKHHVLDVGSGAGDDVIQLAKLVPNGKVIGIDINEEAIETSNRKKLEMGIENIEFYLQNGENLPFDDDMFDAVRSDRVFQHLLNPEKVFEEICRVTKPGGKIMLLSTDWATLTINSDNIETTRKIKNYYYDGYINNAYSGSKIYEIFRIANINILDIQSRTMILTKFSESRYLFAFDSVIQKMIDKDLLSTEEANEWIQELEEKDRNNLYFSSNTGFAVLGVKP